MKNGAIPAEVEHTTSSGLQIIEVKDHGTIGWVLIDRQTRHTFPMDETQWRELQAFIIARNHFVEEADGN